MSEETETTPIEAEVASIAEELEPDTVSNGATVDATVEALGDDEISVALPEGHKGYFEAREGKDALGQWMIKAGQTVSVVVEEQEGTRWRVSMEKAEKVRAYDRLLELAAKKATVQGVVTRRVDGGLSVDIGVRAFLPGRESGMRNHELDGAVGRPISVQITRYNPSKNEVLLSRKELAMAEADEAKDAVFARHKVGDRVKGIVSSLTKFGVFVDLGGAEGLLHNSEIMHTRVDDPGTLFYVGDTIEVEIIELDAEKNRIGLSRKSLCDDPWVSLEGRYPVGDTVSGRVVRIAGFGAFVELEPGVEGLIHTSELSWDTSVRSADGIVAPGDVVQVQVISVDVEKRRMGLSIKRLEANPWTDAVAAFEPGQRLTGTITKVMDYGVFVELVPGVEGLIHVSEMSWTQRVRNPSDLRDFTLGEPLEVYLISVDEARQRIALGLKQLEGNPWAELDSLIEQNGDIVDVTITRIVNYGAFAQVVEGLEGLIHISQLDTEEVSRIEDVVKTGQTVKAKITDRDRKSGRISLSIRAYKEQEEGVMREYKDDDDATTSLGALLKKD